MSHTSSSCICFSSARRCASSSVVLPSVAYVAVSVWPLLRFVVVVAGYRLTGAKGPVSGRPPLNGSTYLNNLLHLFPFEWGGRGVFERFV